MAHAVEADPHAIHYALGDVELANGPVLHVGNNGIPRHMGRPPMVVLLDNSCCPDALFSEVDKAVYDTEGRVKNHNVTLSPKRAGHAVKDGSGVAERRMLLHLRRLVATLHKLHARDDVRLGISECVIPKAVRVGLGPHKRQAGARSLRYATMLWSRQAGDRARQKHARHVRVE